MPSTVTGDLLETLQFDNRFVAELPGDPRQTEERRQVERACYSPVKPTPVAAPILAAHSREAAALLDLDDDACRSSLFLEVFSGSRLLPGMQPYAMCYGGHQFGTWAGQLGDGRAVNLGEVVNRAGERWTLQLKGSGLTPYSRAADGLAVLRSSLREFVCSEAVHHLGIPTTRALSLILSGEKVLRDMFYDGNPKYEPGAVVCRLSPSFIRFGSFEIHAARRDIDILERLVRFTIRTDFPDLQDGSSPDHYLAWFTEVCRRTALLMVDWLRVGFVHGVMNTDNMSILGLTIDYGPYGWLEGYEPTWTPNTTDAQGRRYCYANQPYIAQWNLAQLANSLFPLIGDVKPLQEALERYRTTFQRGWEDAVRAKLGFRLEHDGDNALFDDMFRLLAATETDMTIFFRHLARVDTSRQPLGDFTPLVEDAYYRPEQVADAARRAMHEWLDRYYHRLRREATDDERRRLVMNRVNPKYVFRNYLAQEAIDEAADGDYTRIGRLLDVLRRPYDEQPGQEHFARKRPEWARNRPGCSMLSCSS